MKNIIFLAFLAAMVSFVGCKKTDVTTTPDPDPDKPPKTALPELPKEGVPVRTSLFGMVVDEDENPVSGVMITAGDRSVNTDVNGIYMMDGITVDQARGYILAKKTGYFNGSRIFQPVKDGLSKLAVIKLLKQKSIGTINAATGGAVSTPGGIKVELPANAIEGGYTGTINVVASYINPTSPDFLSRMPGDLAAENHENKRGTMISYGMGHFDLLDGNGNKLKIKSGSEATLTMPVPKSLVPSVTPTIPMWHFDETRGIWKEEGEGTYADGKYTGKVSHFSAWNFDHWNINMVLPAIVKWILSQITPDTSSFDVQDAIENQPTFVLTVKDKASKAVIYTNTFPPLSHDANSNPISASTEVAFPLPKTSELMEVTVTPVIPGSPEYPTNKDYSPTLDEKQPPTYTYDTEDRSVTVDVKATEPPTKTEIVIPPLGGGGSGETFVNVNGKAVNCDNLPIKLGYVYMSMRSGNKYIGSAVSNIYGKEGRFNVQHFFSKQTQDKVDNVIITIYDKETGKQTDEIKLNLNPSVAYMFQEPVKVCKEPGTTTPANPAKVFKGDIALDNTQQLKAFIDSGYTEVTGALYIRNQSDLNGLTKLKKVGVLYLENNSITKLGAIGELESISRLIIKGNTSLTSIAFPKLTSKFLSALQLDYNLSLVSFSLPSIEKIGSGGDGVSIKSSPVLKTLSFPNLNSLAEAYLFEIRTTGLTNLDAFANATGTIPRTIALYDNPELTSVAGLKNITALNRLEIMTCTKLKSLNGINIAEVMEFIKIQNNDELTDVTAITDKLKSTTSGSGINFQNNKSLKNIALPKYEEGVFVAWDNPALETIDLPKLVKSNQVDILRNENLTSVNFPVLQTVGNFALFGTIKENQALKKIDLPSLKTCNDLKLINLSGLTTLDGFNNLETVTGYIDIHCQNINGKGVHLSSISGFNKLTSISGFLSLVYAAGGDQNGPLASITGFKNLKTINRSLGIGGRNLTNISGFKKLETIGEALGVKYTGLTGLEGFEKLRSIGMVGGQLFELNSNDKMTSLKGLASLTEISGIYITNNNALLDLKGFGKIKTMNKDIYINSNGALTNLDDLANIEKSGDVDIRGNQKLNSFCGLSKLIKGNGITTGNYRVNGNKYNPTMDDIKNGKCNE